jgi:gas vesicle protein
MQPQQIQAMTPDEAKASLGVATALQDQLMPQAPVTSAAPEPPQNQENGSDLANQIQGLESRVMDEIGTLKEEMKKSSDGGSEISNLKKQIEEVLNSKD